MTATTIDHTLLARTLRAVHALSGPRRGWVKSSRILDAVVGEPVGSLEVLLDQAPWWSDPRTAPLVALLDLLRRELVEGRGHFGRGFDAPADPVYSECRRLDRPLDEQLAAVAQIADPGATVTTYDPRGLVIDRGLGPVFLGEPLPRAVTPPWSLEPDPTPGAHVLAFAGEPVASCVVRDGVVAMMSPLATGMPVLPDLTYLESVTALRARWGANLVADPASGGRRVWHRDRPRTIASIDPRLDLVLLIEVWAREPPRT